MTIVRHRLRLRGVVQGVGFRPFVHALAERWRLAGHVANDSGGVWIEVEGETTALEAFGEALVREAPPLARIESVETAACPVRAEAGFRILPSTVIPGDVVPVAPDVAPCAACLRELNDPGDRRFRYPFINCTNCGPRYTIVRDVPYDRPLTTMADFGMCPACQAEYEDPAHRRFHAQPNACPVCGPSLAWVDGAKVASLSVDAEDHASPGDETPAASTHGEPVLDASARGEMALVRARELLRAGRIVAVKGVGGFHLAVDAANGVAVARLRERKQRSDKPFALLASDLAMVRRFARCTGAEADLLTSPARPIVLLERAEGSESIVAAEVAPGQRTLGVMLPPSPLHVLLATDGPLVLTSGNRSEEPLARGNDEARQRLAAIADGFLMHDRPIHVVCDDSVVRVQEARELPLRRSRGYAPYPVPLAAAAPPLLAVGAELKATACLTRERYAFLTPHIGDVGNLETLEALERACDHLQRLFRVTPTAIACDAHPGYLSSAWARRLAAARALPAHEVQHHHAHLASLLGDHGLGQDARILAFTFDGTGYGTDGTIWGGEVLLGGYREFVRVAHLAPTPLPGGDAAIRHPARVALAQLWSAGLPWEGTRAAQSVSAVERRVLEVQLARNLHCVPTSSMGRFFDAVSALAGVRPHVSYEGQAAIELEALARASRGAAPPAYRLPLHEGAGGVLTLDGGALLASVVTDVSRGRAVRDVALAVHEAVADAILEVAVTVRARYGVDRVGLTGGVFQNMLLLELSCSRLRCEGFSVLTHRRVPPNDGGLALGQALAAIAAMESP